MTVNHMQCVYFQDDAIGSCAIPTHRAPRDCVKCKDWVPQLSNEERTPCEIWSRCMGYHRPVSCWNPGKQQEHADRQFFREDLDDVTT